MKYYNSIISNDVEWSWVTYQNVARSLCDSWASCFQYLVALWFSFYHMYPRYPPLPPGDNKKDCLGLRMTSVIVSVRHVYSVMFDRTATRRYTRLLDTAIQEQYVVCWCTLPVSTRRMRYVRVLCCPAAIRRQSPPISICLFLSTERCSCIVTCFRHVIAFVADDLQCRMRPFGLLKNMKKNISKNIFPYAP